jgi:alkenylglycerophosphocholine hydrolase
MALPFPVIYLFTIGVAALDWVAVARGWRRVHVVAKPTVIVLLLSWIYFSTGLQAEMLFFGIGLVFSLAGDVFLLFKGQGWFVVGLVTFLLALVSYIIGFNLTPPVTDLFSVVTAILVAVLFARLYRRVAEGLLASGQSRLRLPVLLYTLVLALMLLSAWLTLFRPDWRSVPSLLAASGAALFIASDALLAWNKFVKPGQRGPLPGLVLYQVGQILLITGVTLNYLKT